MEIFTLFAYEEEPRQWFLQFKEGHDYCLGAIFLYGFRRKMRRKYRNFQIVYAPSHENSVKNRGFNVIETMMENVFSSQPIPVFTKGNDVYQKRLNREDRFKNVQDFRADLSLLDKTKGVLLVDDLVTTGATLSILSQTLTKNGYIVQIFSVYRHKTLES
ncbi:ComF family protein [Erysipelothrix larvae]|uniref:ComF family protein n=1 Tax=Erysipelothrix larvae TaxID=1514105 RepID=UPI0012FD8E0D|nr:hypothetical protein [Erysipelothrix larvae]